jgi:hypothetical protein
MRNDGHCHEKRRQIKGDECEDGVCTRCTGFMVIILWCWVGNGFCEMKKQSVVVARGMEGGGFS